MAIVTLPKESTQTWTLEALVGAAVWLVGAPSFSVSLWVVGESLRKGGDEEVLTPTAQRALCGHIADVVSSSHHSFPPGRYDSSCVQRRHERIRKVKKALRFTQHTSGSIWTQFCLIQKATSSLLYSGARSRQVWRHQGAFKTQVSRPPPQR